MYVLLGDFLICTDALHVGADHRIVLLNAQRILVDLIFIVVDSAFIVFDNCDEASDVFFNFLDSFSVITHRLISFLLSVVKSPDIIRVGIDAVCEGGHPAVKGGDVVCILYNTAFKSTDPLVKSSHIR